MQSGSWDIGRGLGAGVARRPPLRSRIRDRSARRLRYGRLLGCYVPREISQNFATGLIYLVAGIFVDASTLGLGHLAFEFYLAPFPIRHNATKELIEFRSMILVLYMAKFVGYDVIY